MFLHRAGGVMSVVVGWDWSARFVGLAWCGVFVFPGSSLIVANGLQEKWKTSCHPKCVDVAL